MKIIYLLLAIITSFILLIPSFDVEIEKKIGNISKATYLAPFDFKIIDIKKTQERIKADQSNILPVYSFSLSKSLKLLKDADDLFSKIEDIRENQKEKEKKIKRLLPYLLPSHIKLIVSCDKRTFIQIEEKTKSIMNICLEKGILKEDIKDKKIEIIKEKNRVGTIRDVKDLFTLKMIKGSKLEKLNIIQGKITDIDLIGWAIASSLLSENLYFDKKTTKRRKEEVDKKPIEIFVKKGDVIIKKGEIIDKLAYEKFKTIAKIEKGISKKTFFSFLTIFFSFLVFLIAFFLKIKELKIEKILAISFISLFIIIIAKCLAIWKSQFLSYLPISSLSILIGLFFSSFVSIFFTFLFNILICHSFFLDLRNLIFFLIPSLFSIFSLQRVKEKKDLIKVCFGIIICNITLSLFFYEEPLRTKIFFSFLNGALVYLITIASLFISEYFFSTNFKFYELSNLNLSLLKTLFLEAPGTYHHSLIVGNLAEEASLSINANHYLARAGSYYHDIGKIINSEYFIENQREKKVLPSFQILKLHIERGISIAKIEHLPLEIINIIRSHHGALEEAYPFLKPKTKEEAIIMLADAVEERIRICEERPSSEMIKSIVHETIKEKILNGELSSSCLTMSEIKKIEESFINILVPLFWKNKYGERKKY